jgi:hypothetical protein
MYLKKKKSPVFWEISFFCKELIAISLSNFFKLKDCRKTQNPLTLFMKICRITQTRKYRFS